MNRREVDSFCEGEQLPVEIAFLAGHGAPLPKLRCAAAIARRQGVSADCVLLAEDLFDETIFY